MDEKLKKLADAVVVQQKKFEIFKTKMQLDGLEAITKTCMDKYNKDETAYENMLTEMVATAQSGSYKYNLFSVERVNVIANFVLPCYAVKTDMLKNIIFYPEEHNIPWLNTLNTAEKNKRYGFLKTYVNIAAKQVCNNMVDSFTKYCKSKSVNLQIKNECNSEDPHAYVKWN